MKLKVCGMKQNVAEVAALRPDYLGFIFWEPSSRYFESEIPELPDGIEKIGVFVDATIEEILEKIKKYDLRGVQLHGHESPEYCRRLKEKYQVGIDQNPMIIKVFSIKHDFDFGVLEPYEEVCNYYLFDTKGKLPGGNGYAFNWKVLENYPSTKPYFLSGGISPEDAQSIKDFNNRQEAKYCHAIDINSCFEIEPGLKDTKKLEKFELELLE